MAQVTESREYKLAKAIENAVNDYGFNRDNFIAGISTMHRTLQQSMWRDIILPIIYHFSHPKFGYDDRNKASHFLAEELQKTISECGSYLPHI